MFRLVDPSIINEDGRIEHGPYDGLYLRPLLICFRDSCWDWPSVCNALGIRTQELNDDFTYDVDGWVEGHTLDFINSLLPAHHRFHDDLEFST